MNKIKKYLESKGYKLSYKETYIASNLSGRSFYNNGKHRVSIYNILDTDYQIENKETGRPRIVLLQSEYPIIVSLSQQDFIDRVDDYLNNMK